MTAVVYDADRVVVVDKQSGPTSEEVAAALQKKLVHRIDRATSGLLILADDARTVSRLQKQLRAGGIERRYCFVGHGTVACGRLDSVLVRDRGDGLRGSALPGTAVAGGKAGKAASCDIVDVIGFASVEGGRGALSLGTARLVSGRTHQLRIQLAEAGHPIVGERVYVRDAARDGLVLCSSPRLLLHAARLRFVHPGADKAVVDIEAPLPDDFRAAAAALGVWR